jgi:hypothetical protein
MRFPYAMVPSRLSGDPGGGLRHGRFPDVPRRRGHHLHLGYADRVRPGPPGQRRPGARADHRYHSGGCRLGLSHPFRARPCRPHFRLISSAAKWAGNAALAAGIAPKIIVVERLVRAPRQNTKRFRFRKLRSAASAPILPWKAMDASWSCKIRCALAIRGHNSTRDLGPGPKRLKAQRVEKDIE